MRFSTAIICLCAVGIAQGNILSDIWKTIKKPLEGIGEAALSSVLKTELSSVAGLFGKRDLSQVTFKLHDEVLKWIQEARNQVEQEVMQVGGAMTNPEGQYSDRIFDLVHDLELAGQHGNIERFIKEYSNDIIKQYSAMIPKRLQSKIWSASQQVSRQTRGNDILIQMLKNITVANWFFSLPEVERRFLVAMLDAAEHGHLHDFVDHHSYDRVLVFIDHMPPEEGHKLNHYLVEHLKQENPSKQKPVLHKPATRDVQEFLTILQEIYSEHFYSLLDKDDRLFLLGLMDAAEHGLLTAFIADHGMERVNDFLSAIPKESGDKLSKFLAEHLKTEGQSSGSHGSHHGHHQRSADILLTILKDIHTADVFFHLPESERQFMIALMDAAENNHLDEFVKKVTLQRVRDFVKHLPDEYQKVMTHYIENHLKAEHGKQSRQLHHYMSIHDVLTHIGEHLHKSSDHYSREHHDFYLQLKHAAENEELKDFINKVGTSKLYSFLNALPDNYATFIEEHILKELGEEDKVIPAINVLRRASSHGHSHQNIHEASHHIEVHLHENHSKYSISQHEFYEQLKHAIDHNRLKAFITQYGTDKLYDFLNALPSELAESLEHHILFELEKEDNVEV